MEKKLTRDISGKMVAGIAAGLAKYFQLDVTWVRIAFVLATFFGGGGLWIYIILWIAVPEDSNPYSFTDYKVNKDQTNNYGSTFKPKEKVNINLIGGLLLIGFGAYFLLDEFDIIPNWFNVGKLWPLVFVVIGLSILFKASQQSKINDFDPSDFKKKTEDDSEVKEEVPTDTDQTDNYNK
ncbi:MAG: PspC domain-containing protein [Pelobium sp.]